PRRRRSRGLVPRGLRGGRCIRTAARGFFGRRRADLAAREKLRGFEVHSFWVESANQSLVATISRRAKKVRPLPCSLERKKTSRKAGYCLAGDQTVSQVATGVNLR